MKRSLITAVLLFVTIPVKAEEPSLKENMKSLGNVFKAIKQSADDSTQNAENAGNADRLLQLFKAVRGQFPRFIAHLPADQQTAAISEYQKTIDDETQLATSLEAAFTKSDNGTAVELVEKLNSDRQSGHRKFKRK